MAKAIRCILLAAAILAAPLTAAAEAKPQARASIVGGTVATIADFPFQAALLGRAFLEQGGAPIDAQFCGAFVLDVRHVGTAAHCVLDERNELALAPSQIRVQVGSARLAAPGESGAPDEDHVNVSAIAFRPGFDPGTFDDDAAVLTLERDLDLAAPGVEGIPLTTSQLASASSATVTGWGYTLAGPPPFDFVPEPELREVAVPVVADGASRCAPAYDFYAASRMVCAGTTAADSCKGDSGGPLVRMADSGTRPTGWRLAGIVSFGLDCADDTAAGVYAEVFDDAPDNEIDEFLTPPFAPDAPRPTEAIDLRGNAVPGETLECHSRWSNAADQVFRVRRVRPGGAADEAEAPDGRYLISSAEVGWALNCEVSATGPGGWGHARSAAVRVAAPAPAATGQEPPPPPPSQPAPPVVDPPKPADTTRPTTRLVRRRCSRTQCSLQVQVTDPPYTSGVRSLLGSGSLEYRSRCRRDGRSQVCTRKRKLSVKPVLLGAGRYSVRVRSRTAGLATLRFVAYDVAGNRQARATQIRVRFGPRR